MLQKVDYNMMKNFIAETNLAFDKHYIEKQAQELIQTLDQRLDDIIYTYCYTGQKKDFSFTQNGETFSVFEIAAMRGCSYYEAVLLMDCFIKNAKTGRLRIMRR